MREIKFRAWDTEDKRLLSNGTLSMIWEDKTWFYQAKGGRVSSNFGIFMQFTGLTDKKGEEIFEGDIVSFLMRGLVGRGSRHKAEVNYIGSSFIIGDSVPLGDGKESVDGDEMPTYYTEFEVIGNIYENPELLK